MTGLVAWLCALLNEADVVIGQNVRRFDMRKIRARAVTLGLVPIPRAKGYRHHGDGQSYRRFHQQQAGVPEQGNGHHPLSSSTQTTRQGTVASAAAATSRPWRECEAYNKRDVVATENVCTLALRPWAHACLTSRSSTMMSTPLPPRCGSVNLKTTAA